MRRWLLVRCSCLWAALLLLSAGAAQAQGGAVEAALLAQRYPAAQFGEPVLHSSTRGPVTEHRTWRPMRGGRWCWPATFRVSVVRATGRVLAVQVDGLRPLALPGTPLARPSARQGDQITETYLIERVAPADRAAVTVRERVPIWYAPEPGSEARPGWLLRWGHPDTRLGAWEVVLDEATGQPAFPPRDLLCYHHSGGLACTRAAPPPGPRDTTAVALVFRPDPLTTAHQPYGRPFIDSLDTDRPALNQQRVVDTLWLTFAADSLRLRNAWFQVAEFDPPARPVVAARTAAGLQFTREAAGFEQVNALYHLTRARQYVARLGYGSLHDRPMRVDVSGLSGADQSRFSPIDTTLSYGEGGVDDAEDADVVVHEYAHALAYFAAPGTTVGLERRTLDEGNADYWAAVHSARLSGAGAFGREQVFNWDGHNEFWAGRWVISPRKYPRDLVHNIYLDADVWSATLWQIRAALPDSVADRLFLQHLYGYAPNLTMPEAANLFLQADTLLYGAAHAATIYQYFDDRYILGSHAVVGEEPAAAPTGGDVRVWATDAFARGEAARVHAPTGSWLTLLSITGAPVWQGRVGDGAPASVPAADLAPGVYVLRILTNGSVRSERLLRH